MLVFPVSVFAIPVIRLLPRRISNNRRALRKEVFFAKFGAGEFAAFIRGQRIDEPPVARHLPDGQTGQQELLQCLA